jgi:hypothetical protein
MSDHDPTTNLRLGLAVGAMDPRFRAACQEALDGYDTLRRKLAKARAHIQAAQESTQRLLDRGKGTWPEPDYVRNETWNYWRGEEAALRQALNIIDAALKEGER